MFNALPDQPVPSANPPSATNSTGAVSVSCNVSAVSTPVSVPVSVPVSRFRFSVPTLFAGNKITLSISTFTNIMTNVENHSARTSEVATIGRVQCRQMQGVRLPAIRQSQIRNIIVIRSSSVTNTRLQSTAFRTSRLKHKRVISSRRQRHSSTQVHMARLPAAPTSARFTPSWLFSALPDQPVPSANPTLGNQLNRTSISTRIRTSIHTCINTCINVSVSVSVPVSVPVSTPVSVPVSVTSSRRIRRRRTRQVLSADMARNNTTLSIST